MRYAFAVVLVIVLSVGCAKAGSDVGIPVYPDMSDEEAMRPNSPNTAAIEDPHRLWGEWTLYFSADHDRVDVVPVRSGRTHFNVLRLLEEFCSDCLKVTDISDNGDGTINLTVRLKHPYPDHPEFTGFDVKGIIMFQGSQRLLWLSRNFFPYNDAVKVSWKELGDPEVMNADGFTPRWCPEWDSGSDKPVFRYWPGKLSRGTPTANVNAFLNFYTDEDRHMFRSDGWVEETYHIWLPPGPLVAGYAVDACWVQPKVTPVTDPASDFPFSANQPEPYFFEIVVNNNEVIDFEPCCGGDPFGDCTQLWAEARSWYGPQIGRGQITTRPDARICGWGATVCQPGTAPNDDCVLPGGCSFTDILSNGKHQGVAMAVRNEHGLHLFAAYDVFDFEIQL